MLSGISPVLESLFCICCVCLHNKYSTSSVLLHKAPGRDVRARKNVVFHHISCLLNELRNPNPSAAIHSIQNSNSFLEAADSSASFHADCIELSASYWALFNIKLTSKTCGLDTSEVCSTTILPCDIINPQLSLGVDSFSCALQSILRNGTLSRCCNGRHRFVYD